MALVDSRQLRGIWKTLRSRQYITKPLISNLGQI